MQVLLAIAVMSAHSSWRVMWLMPIARSLSMASSSTTWCAVGVADDRVGAQRDHSRGHGPDVQVVHAFDVRDAGDALPDFVERDVPRRGLEQHVDALAEQAPRARRR